jgi:hypothetical protein
MTQMGHDTSATWSDTVIRSKARAGPPMNRTKFVG